ncbi:MAG: DNA-directed RNA polymerase specialized sigma24 family protein [Paraglaciecola sp.]
MSEKCNVPIGTVKSRIFFARKNLSSQMKKFFDLDDLRG